MTRQIWRITRDFDLSLREIEYVCKIITIASFSNNIHLASSCFLILLTTLKIKQEDLYCRIISGEILPFSIIAKINETKIKTTFMDTREDEKNPNELFNKLKPAYANLIPPRLYCELLKISHQSLKDCVFSKIREYRSQPISGAAPLRSLEFNLVINILSDIHRNVNHDLLKEITNACASSDSINKYTRILELSDYMDENDFETKYQQEDKKKFLAKTSSRSIGFTV